MPTFLEIAVNLPQVSGVFHYHLPPELEGKVQVGHLVEVPFGQQTVQGVVLRPVDSPSVPETRPVLSVVDEAAVLTAAQIALAGELSHATLAPLAACIALMLPPGLTQQADTLYSITDKGSLPSARRLGTGGKPAKTSQLQTRLLELLLQRGPLRGRQIDQSLPRVNWRAAARNLVARGWISTRSILPPPAARPKYIRTAQLACPPDEAEKELDNLGRAGSQALQRRQAMLNFMLREPGPVDVTWIYAESGGNLGDLRVLAERGLVILGESQAWRDPLEAMPEPLTQPPPLTRDQKKVWEEIQKSLQTTTQGEHTSPFLLHGVTGSGKTEIYLHAVAETIRLGRQAIVLVPEIALTPQTVRRFVARFPGRVGLVHSGLSPGERYDTWRRARRAELSVVVGPRSALFTPFSNLGMIIVDECHDDTYYQSDPLPHYHAREAAVRYARICGAVCLLGSATPDITSRFHAEQGDWRYLSLPARILAHRQTVKKQLERLATAQRGVGEPHLDPSKNALVSRYLPVDELAEAIELPPVQIVDMRRELKEGNRSIFSRALQAALKDVLERGLQAILFLNRRGTATYVFCRDCGAALRCPRCEIPLTYHTSRNTGFLVSQALICHHCGYRRNLPPKCPQCSSKRIRHYGTGTERVEAEVQELYPGVRTLRWDYETTRQKGAHDLILSHFSQHHADILVGTQMVAKGLDLPLVTLVGVVLADVGLNLPDYRAPERVFQVLTQVAGRAGRSPLGGQVILQTFLPDHYTIQTAARHDYTVFYQQERAHRRKLNYPPFANLLRLEFRHTNASQCEKAARSLAAEIKTWLAEEDRSATEMVGPVPCFYTRIAGSYRWQIVLRGPDPASLLRHRQLGEWRIEINPPSLL